MVKPAMDKDVSPPGYPDEAAPTTSAMGNFNTNEMEGLTVYEKKCMLINHEIDSNVSTP